MVSQGFVFSFPLLVYISSKNCWVSLWHFLHVTLLTYYEYCGYVSVPIPLVTSSIFLPPPPLLPLLHLLSPLHYSLRILACVISDTCAGTTLRYKIGVAICITHLHHSSGPVILKGVYWLKFHDVVHCRCGTGTVYQVGVHLYIPEQ